MRQRDVYKPDINFVSEQNFKNLVYGWMPTKGIWAIVNVSLNDISSLGYYNGTNNPSIQKYIKIYMIWMIYI